MFYQVYSTNARHPVVGVMIVSQQRHYSLRVHVAGRGVQYSMSGIGIVAPPDELPTHLLAAAACTTVKYSAARSGHLNTCPIVASCAHSVV